MVAMASPQKEHGYTAIAHELLEWVARAPLNGSQFRLLMAVVRKTYGFQKKEDRISATQFHEATGLHKQVIARELRDLAKRGYLVSIGDVHHAKSYQIQKNYQLWDEGKVYTDWLTEKVETDPVTPDPNCIPIGAGVYTDPLTEVYTDPLTTIDRKKTTKAKSTEPHGSGTAAPPVRVGTLRQQFEEDYLAATDRSKRIGVAGVYFGKMLGPPKFERMKDLLKLAGSGGAFFAALAEAAKQTITDDPHDYLQAILQRQGGASRASPAGQVSNEQAKFTRSIAALQGVGGHRGTADIPDTHGETRRRALGGGDA